MKRLLIPFLALALCPPAIALAERSPLHRREEQEQRADQPLSGADQTIRNVDPKRLPFDAIIYNSGEGGVTQILYDRAVEGDHCFLSCNNYNGVTSKWSDFYVELQPFENFCLVLTGCSSQYPLPPNEVVLHVSGKSYPIRQVDPTLLRYYIPLEARKDLAKSSGTVSIDIAGIKMPKYRIGSKNRQLLAKLVNVSMELDEYLMQRDGPSKSDKLSELKALLEKGEITQEEHDSARREILRK